LPIEAIVRGYLIGSGWKDYRLPAKRVRHRVAGGAAPGQRLPEPIFTPATATPGDHDENISYAQRGAAGPGRGGRRARHLAGAVPVRSRSPRAARIIIADTKFEFGLAPDGELLLIDEVLTPDSSRFWPADSYRVGISPPSFDKQFVRDYLETLDWDKRAPGPRLPPEVIRRTADKYQEALHRITGPASATAPTAHS
jgi:phosphoribosylaminoimidazole-succinocarboxamide synthase